MLVTAATPHAFFRTFVLAARRVAAERYSTLNMKSPYIILLLVFTFSLQGCKESEGKSETVLELKTKLSVIQYKQGGYLINEKIKKRDNLYSQNEVFLLRNKFDFFMESFSKETDSLITFLDSVELHLLSQENLDDKTLYSEINDSTLLRLYNHEKSTKYMLETDNKYSGKAIQNRINHFISTFNSGSSDVFVSKLFFEPITLKNTYTEEGNLFSWEYTFDHLPLVECLRTLQTIKQKTVELNIQAFNLENCIEKPDLRNREIKSHDSAEAKD